MVLDVIQKSFARLAGCCHGYYSHARTINCIYFSLGVLFRPGRRRLHCWIDVTDHWSACWFEVTRLSATRSKKCIVSLAHMHPLQKHSTRQPPRRFAEQKANVSGSNSASPDNAAFLCFFLLSFQYNPACQIG